MDVPINAGPNAGTYVNESGTRQSRLDIEVTRIPPEVILALGSVFTYGARKYGPDNWRGSTPRELMDHVLLHLILYLCGDKQDDHLGHALCRLAMYVAQEQPDWQEQLAKYINGWAIELHTLQGVARQQQS